MKERRVFRSAAEVAAFCAGEAFGRLVEREVAGSRVVFGLLRLRLSRDLSVETLARRMECDSEKIRRMPTSAVTSAVTSPVRHAGNAEAAPVGTASLLLPHVVDELAADRIVGMKQGCPSMH